MNKLSFIYFVEEDYIAIFRDNKMLLQGIFEQRSDSGSIDLEDFLEGCQSFCTEQESFELPNGKSFNDHGGIETKVAEDLLRRLQLGEKIV